jgi:hypothetical protein
MDIDKIIKIVRNLNEEGPTVSIGSGITAGADKHIAGMVGEPPVRKRKKPPVIARGLMPGARKRWSNKG